MFTALSGRVLRLKDLHSFLRHSKRRFHSSPSLSVLRLEAAVQSYISTCSDPFVNLSFEHYLLQSAPPTSVILFQYVNAPSLVIGRNQNPWTELNLPLLRSHQAGTTPGPLGSDGEIKLVRRRSGGGAVWHDEGNVNWSVVCPSAEFTRDKHVEMVVRALRDCSVERARVNERHDIVLDQGPRRQVFSEHDSHGAVPEMDSATAEEGSALQHDTHASAFEPRDADGRGPFKVSGSAYKLTRQRSLHHATALCTSPHLASVGHYLRSPARDHITAKGVSSVASPITNIGLEPELFMRAVWVEFIRMYRDRGREGGGGGATGVHMATLDEAQMTQFESIRRSVTELKSDEWFWDQTPGFTAHVDGVKIEAKHGAAEVVKSNGVSLPAVQGKRLWHENIPWPSKKVAELLAVPRRAY